MVHMSQVYFWLNDSNQLKHMIDDSHPNKHLHQIYY